MDSRIISDSQAEVISALVKCCDENGWKYALIGAMALSAQGIDLGRFTRDLDFTVLIKSCENLETLKERIKRYGFIETESPHRFKFKSEIVDILPVCGGYKDVIYWPTGERMSMLGLFDAVKHATLKRIRSKSGEIEVYIAPIPIVVLMKIIACAERSECEDTRHAYKHLKDVLSSLKQYETESLRRFDYVEVVKGAKDEFECAGAYLLGVDLKEMFSIASQTLHILLKCLGTCMQLANEINKDLLKCLQIGFQNRSYFD